MSLLAIFMLAIGLSMDAFSVAICKGLSMKKITVAKMLVVGTWFGLFQAMMPLIGYYLGSAFSSAIVKIDHWIAFVLLSFIGINMIKEALEKEVETPGNKNTETENLSFKEMFILAVATSIDALACGITFAFLKVNIWVAVSLIGATTFVFGFCGVKIGNVFGVKYKSKAELAGGIILIVLGVKILIEHLMG